MIGGRAGRGKAGSGVLQPMPPRSGAIRSSRRRQYKLLGLAPTKPPRGFGVCWGRCPRWWSWLSCRTLSSRRMGRTLPTGTGQIVGGAVENADGIAGHSPRGLNPPRNGAAGLLAGGTYAPSSSSSSTLVRVHAGRVAGGDRDHRGADLDPAARPGQGAGAGEADGLPFQPAVGRADLPGLRQQQQGLRADRLRGDRVPAVDRLLGVGRRPLPADGLPVRVELDGFSASVLLPGAIGRAVPVRHPGEPVAAAGRQGGRQRAGRVHHPAGGGLGRRHPEQRDPPGHAEGPDGQDVEAGGQGDRRGRDRCSGGTGATFRSGTAGR